MYMEYLLTGMVVTLRDKSKYMVMRNCAFGGGEDILVPILLPEMTFLRGKHIRMMDYGNDNMRNLISHDKDIMRIDVIEGLTTKVTQRTVWEREDEVKHGDICIYDDGTESYCALIIRKISDDAVIIMPVQNPNENTISVIPASNNSKTYYIRPADIKTVPKAYIIRKIETLCDDKIDFINACIADYLTIER